MKAKQLYLILIGCCCLIIVLFFGVAYGANKLLAGQANKLSTLRALNSAVQEQQTGLITDKTDIGKYGSLNTIAASIVPQDKDQAEAVQQIVNIAKASGIPVLTSISFPASTLGITTSGSPKPNMTQLIPVSGINGVYNLGITITQSNTGSIPYANFLQFLSGLEQNRRTAEVTSISIEPNAIDPGKVSFTLIINEFIKP